jgi:flavin-dependent dehydrogenase
MSATFAEQYDIVIVGARCAGAAFATFAGRAGARVLMVDRSALPSDLVLSTHTLHPSGARVLAQLGVLGRLRQSVPPIRTLRIGRGNAILDVPFTDEDAEYCPRRRTLDGLLQDSARDAGVTVLDRTTAQRLELQDGRVRGVYLQRHGEAEALVRADLVVGADGRDSCVAHHVRAPCYLDYPAPRAIYWSYWRAPAGYGSSPDQPGMYVVNQAGVVRMAFHTEADQVLVASAPEIEQAHEFRSDPLAALQRDLARDARLAPFTRSPPCEKVRGYLPRRYFLREPVGPGWLLLGDAGMHQEFVTGNGMSEALRQAESAGRALLGGPGGWTRWWRERDVAALPMFLFGQLQGARGAPPRLDALVLAHAARSPELQARFARSLTGELSPLRVVSPLQVAGWAARAALQGRAGVLVDFIRRARLSVDFERIQARHRGLLARA